MQPAAESDTYSEPIESCAIPTGCEKCLIGVFGTHCAYFRVAMSNTCTTCALLSATYKRQRPSVHSAYGVSIDLTGFAPTNTWLSCYANDTAGLRSASVESCPTYLMRAGSGGSGQTSGLGSGGKISPAFFPHPALIRAAAKIAKMICANFMAQNCLRSPIS